jgi:hypothetical protein
MKLTLVGILSVSSNNADQLYRAMLMKGVKDGSVDALVISEDGR